MKPPRLPYLDSSVYMAAVKGPDAKGLDGERAPIARHVLSEAERGTYPGPSRTHGHNLDPEVVGR